MVWQGPHGSESHGHCQLPWHGGSPPGIIISWEGLGNGPTWEVLQGHHSLRHIQVNPVAPLATTVSLPHLAPAQSLQSSTSLS